MLAALSTQLLSQTNIMDLREQIKKRQRYYFGQGYTWDLSHEMAIKSLIVEAADNISSYVGLEIFDFEDISRNIGDVLALYNLLVVVVGAKTKMIDSIPYIN